MKKIIKSWLYTTVVGLIRKTMYYKVISTQRHSSQEYSRGRNISVSRQFTTSLHLGLFSSLYKFNENFGFQTLLGTGLLDRRIMSSFPQLTTKWDIKPYKSITAIKFNKWYKKRYMQRVFRANSSWGLNIQESCRRFHRGNDIWTSSCKMNE